MALLFRLVVAAVHYSLMLRRRLLTSAAAAAAATHVRCSRADVHHDELPVVLKHVASPHNVIHASATDTADDLPLAAVPVRIVNGRNAQLSLHANGFQIQKDPVPPNMDFYDVDVVRGTY
jgi:hypothetical protein